MIEDEMLKIGEIYIYLEFYGCFFIDLILNIVLVVVDKVDV